MAELRLLGPVELAVVGRQIEMGPPQRRIVLAVLAVAADRMVTIETLVDRIWGREPPPRARRSLHAHVARIRRTLEQTCTGGDDCVRLVRRSGGYHLDITPEGVDVHQFRNLIERARAAERPDGERVALLRDALGLWRGEPLAALPGEWAARMRVSWRREYLDAMVAWAQCELRVGNPGAVIGPVGDVVGEHPLVESLTAVLMRALYAIGRPAEALDQYTKTRRHLVDELGADPGPELQAVHQAILRGELDPPHAPAAVVARPVPAQLPAGVPTFTGRRAELARLDALLVGAGTSRMPGGSGEGEPTAVVVSAVSGTAGVGKTALAIRWAHRACDQFPDGQLYVNLRGYDPDQPMTAADALARFLSALGVAAPDIPLEVDDRAARYRTQIAGRRILVVLDNASSVEQVRPLLPGSGSCCALVTSRDSLAGLVAVHGAHRLELGLLPAADAHALLRRLIGTRVEAEPEAAAALADQCARLPLALRVAAELAVSRPTTRLADLVTELADEQTRLDLLDSGGDARAAVAAVFSWSIQHLPLPAARSFRMLGLHPGPDLDPYAAAALADTSLDQARRTLNLLARAHLVHPTGPGRYGMHDLLRAYATSLATAKDAADDPMAALGRLFDYYLATAAAATDRLYPGEQHRGPRIHPADTPVPALADPDTARGWLDAERLCLVAVAAHTAARGWPTHAVRLSTTLFRYLIGGHYTDALAVHTHARDAAGQARDRAGEAQALLGLGAAHMRLGQHAPANEYLQHALALFRQSGDQVGQARTLNNLGVVEQRLSRYDSAVDHYRQALVLYRKAGDQSGETWALNTLGVAEERLGHYVPAADHHRQALTLSQQLGDRSAQANALNNLGVVEERLGHYVPAADHHWPALALYQQAGDQAGEAWALNNLGTVHTRLGRPEQAAEHHRQALTRFREIGDRDGEASTLNGLGEAAHTANHPVDAIAQHTAAHTVAADIGARDQQARAHTGLGHAHHTLGDLTRAREHYEHALALYTDLGMPDADHVRAHLATLDHPARPPAERSANGAI